MSMFYELMMRKKEEIMYATIKGSLTENDGVFSGFSGTNYLALQNQFTLSPTTKAEFNFKINISSLTNNNAIFGSITNYGLYVGVNSSGNLELFVGDNSSWTTTQTGTTTLSTSTDYDIKLNINNNIATLYINGNIELTANLGLVSTNTYDMGVGRGITTSDYFRGSIDINNSYVKVGVKYNLQAVVGWTKVGEPTIVDGVMTRANASDTSYIYFKLNEIKNSIKVNMKFKVTSLNVNSYLFDPAGYSLSFRVSNANKIVCRIFPLFNSSKSYTVTGTTTIQADTWYWIRVDLNKERVIAYLSLDGITYTQDGSLEFETQMNFPHNFNGEAIRIGYSSASNLIIGSIDLNNTDVNIDNKLYFNGQQA